MSSVYHVEPPTRGKVIFHTTYGAIDVELWSKEAPRACRNFVQLALEGYYDRTCFHRVIPGFMAQGGDPTGTGEGGDSLAMANENRPDTNRAQFFFTLDACSWLDGKHTIFGTVAGNTVFNLLRMGEAEIGDGDRPTEVIELKTVEVLDNPFDDVVPRDLAKGGEAKEKAEAAEGGEEGGLPRARSPREKRDAAAASKRRRDAVDEDGEFAGVDDDFGGGDARKLREAEGGQGRSGSAKEAKDDKLREAKAAKDAALKNKRAKTTKGRESDTLARLAAFSSSLKTSKSDRADADAPPAAPAMDWLGGDDDGDDADWFAGKLKFRKHTDDLFRTGGDGRSADDDLTLDPREKPKSYPGTTNSRDDRPHKES
ncbi:peptidyl-prolyl cis-trans isomerase [Aureococcus anophagefferens]|nr:peptidyl-prolyl cis-trans isomerase [Aureococcus anophagefferens]